MASTSFLCDIRQGFNFEKDRQSPVGYVTALTVAGQKLTPDITVTDPLNIESGKVKAVGVLSRAGWEGGYSDPLELEMQVSGANKSAISSLVHQKLSNTKVNVQFAVYGFDPDAKEAQYYKAFDSNEKDLECLVQKQGGELHIAIQTDPDGTVQSPRNYTFMLSVVPQDKEQTLHLAVGLGKKFVKRFGVDVKK